MSTEIDAFINQQYEELEQILEEHRNRHTEAVITLSATVDVETSKLLFKDIGYTIADLAHEKDGLTDEQRSKLVTFYQQLREQCIPKEE